MTTIELGSYVTHTKLSELGTGEILSVEKGVVRIRFASGERSFQTELASPYLNPSEDVLPAPTSKAKPKARAKKSKAAKAT